MALWFKIPDQSSSSMPDNCSSCGHSLDSGSLFRQYMGGVVGTCCIIFDMDHDRVTDLTGREFCPNCGGLGRWDMAMPGDTRVCPKCCGLGAVKADRESS